MLTRSIIVYLMILTAVVMFSGIGCSSDKPQEKKAGDNTATENANTTSAADTAQDPNTASANTLQGDTSTDNSSLTGTDSATNTGGDASTVDPNGIVSARDAGSASLTGMGSTGTPDQNKEINSRGDVNIKDKVAIIKTNYGDMYFFFFPDVAPNHVRNFIYLAEKKFYDNVKFHRIVKDFMAQGGMPRPDWTEEILPLKLEVDPQLIVRHRPGALAAARTSDPDSATSQFFIDFTELATKNLNGKYTVYGQMFKGQDTLDKLNKIKLGANAEMGGGEISTPLEDVRIIGVVIEDAAKYDGEIKSWKAQNGM
jgi:cyclophilin family peptidyl-prolyl cis-trans isomerase